MLAMILWELSQVLHAWLRREGSLFGLLAAWWEIASGQIPVGD